MSGAKFGYLEGIGLFLLCAIIMQVQLHYRVALGDVTLLLSLTGAVFAALSVVLFARGWLEDWLGSGHQFVIIMKRLHQAILVGIGAYVLLGGLLYLNAVYDSALERRPATVAETGHALTFGTDFSRHAYVRLTPRDADGSSMTLLLTEDEARTVWPGQAVSVEVKSGLFGLARVIAVKPDEEVKYREMLKVAPTATVALQGLTRIFADSGRLDEAEEMARRYLAVSDDPKEIWYIGAKLFQQHKLADAYRLMRLVYEKKPDTENTITVGWVLAKLGRREEGIPYLAKAVEMEPDNYLTHYHIGYVQMELGRKEDAIRSFRNVLRLKPNYPEIEQALRQLGSTP